MDQQFKIEPLTVCHTDFIGDLAEHLRKQDQLEMEASRILSSYTEINYTIGHSRQAFRAATMDGRAIAAFGVIRQQEGGQIWCLGTSLLKRYSKSFVKISRSYIDKWLLEYSHLFNFVWIHNRDSIKWLKHMGAEFPRQIEFNSNEFLEFRIDKE